MVTTSLKTTVHTDDTQPLLAAGALAGPLYIGLGALQMIIRPGFDLRVHDLSLLSNAVVMAWVWISAIMGRSLGTPQAS